MIDEKNQELQALTEDSYEGDPCETCLRWWECNGIDEECPLR